MSKISKWWSTIRRRPYVEIISDEFDEKNGFVIKLDWNNSFIKELLKAGIEGDSDEEMVQIWLQSIMRSQDMDEYEEELLNIAKQETLRHAQEQQEP